MTPYDQIANLDAALSRRGELVTVRRYTAPNGTPRPKLDIDNVPAAVRAARPDEIVAGVDQTASKVVLSPTHIAAVLPIRKGDKLVVQGRERNIEFPMPIFIGLVLVRIDLLVTG